MRGLLGNLLSRARSRASGFDIPTIFVSWSQSDQLSSS